MLYEYLIEKSYKGIDAKMNNLWSEPTAIYSKLFKEQIFQKLLIYAINTV